MRGTLAALFLCLAALIVLIGGAESASARAELVSENRVGLCGENPNIDTKEFIPLALPLQSGSGNVNYDVVSGVCVGPNLYTYVNQNPWSAFDPLGLKTPEKYGEEIEKSRTKMADAKTEASEIWDSVKGNRDDLTPEQTARLQDLETTYHVEEARIRINDRKLDTLLDAAIHHNASVGVIGSIDILKIDDEVHTDIIDAFRRHARNNGLKAIGKEGGFMALGGGLAGLGKLRHVLKTRSGPRATGKQLLPGEGAVGTYDDLIAEGTKGDNITPHHIPSANHMAQHGVSKGDGIAINMEQPFQGAGGRHRQTFTYGNRADASLSARDALGRGVQDTRRIYQQDGLYTPQIRRALQELIRQNRAANPGLFTRSR